ncbi:long-chain acyl-CoA synthetase [Parelusimicrobium proximum]|uniref:class I adenylate-forming enzyme family protein n=1 Tax=Parelusimicrobium proximum TaxID=3228953 RepID=UPI003D175BCE
MIRRKDLYTAVADSAYRYPERVAAVFEDKRWTYHELLMQIDRAADMFWEHGVRKGDKVAIAHRNSIWFVIAGFALYKIGAVSVPVNFMISKFEELKFIIEDCEVKMVVTQQEFLRTYAPAKEKLPQIEYLFLTDGVPEKYASDPTIKSFQDAVEKSKFDSAVLEVKVTVDDPAFILYTSGTTANPKGAVVKHGNVSSNIVSTAQIFTITDEDTFLCLLPMFHTFAWMTCVCLPLYLGLKTVISANITPPQKWLHMMGLEKVTLFIAIPQIFSVLAKEARGLKRLYMQYWAFRKVRFGISGAAPLGDEASKHFTANLGLEIKEGYGLTETGPILSVNSEDRYKNGSVGPALPDVQIVIKDDDENNLGRNEEGEICAKGPNVFGGYYKNEEATKDAFTKDGYFKTGDIGIVDDEGFIFIRDRKKDMIIIKGLKVFSSQVEATIMKFPGISECALIGVPDGKGGEFIKLYIVRQKDGEFDETGFRKYLKLNLDSYKRPRELEFMDALPKNSMQKILKRELRKDAIAKFKARTAAASDNIESADTL